MLKKKGERGTNPWALERRNKTLRLQGLRTLEGSAAGSASSKAGSDLCGWGRTCGQIDGEAWRARYRPSRVFAYLYIYKWKMHHRTAVSVYVLACFFQPKDQIWRYDSRGNAVPKWELPHPALSALILLVQCLQLWTLPSPYHFLLPTKSLSEIHLQNRKMHSSPHESAKVLERTVHQIFSSMALMSPLK